MWVLLGCMRSLTWTPTSMLYSYFWSCVIHCPPSNNQINLYENILQPIVALLVNDWIHKMFNATCDAQTKQLLIIVIQLR